MEKEDPLERVTRERDEALAKVAILEEMLVLKNLKINNLTSVLDKLGIKLADDPATPTLTTIETSSEITTTYTTTTRLQLLKAEFHALPSEIIVYLAQFLSPAQLANLAATCKDFYSALSKHALLFPLLLLMWSKSSL